MTLFYFYHYTIITMWEDIIFWQILTLPDIDIEKTEENFNYEVIINLKLLYFCHYSHPIITILWEYIFW